MEHHEFLNLGGIVLKNGQMRRILALVLCMAQLFACVPHVHAEEGGFLTMLLGKPGSSAQQPAAPESAGDPHPKRQGPRPKRRAGYSKIRLFLSFEV